MKKIKFGVIGAGGIAQTAHIPSLKRIEEAEITAIADINQEKLLYVKDTFDIKNTFTDWEKMLETDIDAVVVASPNTFHAQHSIRAMESGKDVLCEKPISLTAKDVLDIFQTADKTNKIFMAGLPKRFSGEAKVLKPMIERGEFGEIYYLKASYLRRRGIPGLGTWFTSKKLAGGGPMLDVGVHMLDLILYLAGAPEPEIVMGATYEKFKDSAIDGGWPPIETRKGDISTGKMEVEDLACGFVKLSNGATLVIEASWSGNSEAGLKASLFGTLAGVSMPDPSDPKNPVRIFSENNGVLTDILPEIPTTDVFYEEMLHFIDCVKTRKEPLIKKKEVVSVVKIIENIYKSAETGKPIIL
ncbi:MAG: Gfo/Idh/MocA family oxidoreductase [Elusimicrobia bacterium]|nr:Gfo/Idh/MocA family oxidoreductase [Elusimicrobiota bacterium]